MANRWAVLSDVHSNFCALEEVLEDAEAQEIDGYLFLGDAVGYGPEPHRCLQALRERVNGGPWVLGNHDEALNAINGDPPREPPAAVEEKIGQREETWLALRSNYELLRLRPEDLEHLAARAKQSRLGERVVLIHGGGRRGEPTTTYTRIPEQARDELKALDNRGEAFDLLLVGHTHLPAAFREIEPGGHDCQQVKVKAIENIELGNRRWVLNPGSVGQPRNGDPRAAYMILDLGRNVAEFRRVEYAHETTQKRMELLDLPEILIRRLAAGRDSVS